MPEPRFQAAWKQIACRDINTIRDCILTGFKDGKPFAPDAPRVIGSQYKRILDFGCGLGRNFPLLRSLCDVVHAYDLPEMVEKCRIESSESIQLLTSNWNEIARHHYDLIYASLVVQHLDLPVLQSFLIEWSHIADRVFVHTRCYLDDGGGNVLRQVLASGTTDVEFCSVPVVEALQLKYPSESHFEVLLKTRTNAVASTDA